ncbi:MAG: DEAD/DEAH box helicase [Planctomycetota bacterium]
MTDKDVSRFLDAYGRLVSHDFARRLKIQGVANIGPKDVQFLLHTASIFANADVELEDYPNQSTRAWAYDVATRVAESFGESIPRVVDAAEFILSKLGNFPGRKLLKEQFAKGEERQVLRFPALRLEALMREAENTLARPRLEPLVLTDFQERLYRSLSGSRAVSVSAPTSAGKSFVLAHNIVSTLTTRRRCVLVYIVPTRALIQQVTFDLLQLFRDSGIADAVISAAPVPITEKNTSKSCVYVLTQERLVSLLDNDDFQSNIYAAYIDEAQEIGDSSRGLILDSAIRDLLRRDPGANIYLASPLTKNPGYLLGEFDLQKEGHFFTDTLPPVSQAIVDINMVSGKTKAVDVAVRTPRGAVSVGRAQIPFRFRGVIDRLAGTAIFVRQAGESALVYANRPSDAMNIAEAIAEKVGAKEISEDVKDLIKFVKTHIHPKYLLASCLASGVAFHYGRMPHIVRSRIEALVRSRDLEYVVSTSTLLQGVNLPAKHIVILNPKKGTGNAMPSPDFWNLVGRAGRLRENFHGIVWCVDPTSWESKPFDGERLSEIKSAFTESIESEQIRETAVEVLVQNAPIEMVTDRIRVEQLLGKSFAEFTAEDKRLSESTRVPEAVRSEVIELDEKLEELRSNLQVPEDLCRLNATIAPFLLDDLWERFSSGVTQTMVPIDPQQAGAIDHFRGVFMVIEEVFIRSGGESWRYHATLAYFWVRGKTLKELIDNRLSYDKTSTESKEINNQIRRLLDDLEQTLHFTYVKYLKAYIGVLRAFYRSSGEEKKAEAVSPWDLYVEFGARDRVLLQLMSLGISRTTSILIRNAITKKQEIDRDACWSKLSTLPLKVLDIPGVCKEEIRRLTGNTK